MTDSKESADAHKTVQDIFKSSDELDAAIAAAKKHAATDAEKKFVEDL